MPRRKPWFPLYTNDWLASTKIAMMTPAQEGAYIRLLCYAWNDDDCSIPDDDQQLAILSRLGEGWLKDGSPMVRECFKPHPEISGRLINHRLWEERQKCDQWIEKSRTGGIRSGQSRRSKVKGGSPMVRECFKPNGKYSQSQSHTPLTPHRQQVPGEESPDQTALSDGFDLFWAAYPRKIAKAKAKQVWMKLNPNAELRATIMAAIERQKTSTQWTKDGGQFIPYPATWLNQRRWEDEPLGNGQRAEMPTAEEWLDS